ncbi:MAG: hypothetical protein ACKVP7_26170 [Hyphomicrobiaceae bacterium]
MRRSCLARRLVSAVSALAVVEAGPTIGLARAADAPAITAAATQLAKPDLIKASLGKVLVAVSPDVPVGFREILKRNTKFTSIEIVEDPSITSKHGKVYIDGSLMQINVFGNGLATEFPFSRLTSAMIYIKEYLETKKPSIIGPVAPP